MSPLEIFRFPVPFASFALNDKWYVSQMHLSNRVGETQNYVFVSLDQKLRRAQTFLCSVLASHPQGPPCSLGAVTIPSLCGASFCGEKGITGAFSSRHVLT